MTTGKKVFSCLIIGILFFFPGCWDRKEINRIGFAVGLGIDKDSKGYQITTQMALPSLLEGGGGGEEAPVWVVGGKGRTIFEAIRDVNTRSARRPFWGHLNVIVIGEEVAKNGLIPVLDLLSRGQELRRSNYVVVAKGKARDILEAEPKLESINAIFISNLIENRTGQSIAPVVTLNDLLISLSTPGIESVLPKIQALDQESFLPPQKKEEQAGPKDEGEEKPKQILELRGAGIFKKDKFVTWMDEETTRGYLWVKGQVKGGIIVIKNPAESDRDLSLEIKRNKSFIFPCLENGKNEILMKVVTFLNLVENTGIVSVETEELIQDLNQKASESIKKEINKAIKVAQEFETDIFGIGEKVRTQYPELWEQMEWSQVFPGMDIKVEVETVTQEAAMTLRPIMPPTQRRK